MTDTQKIASLFAKTGGSTTNAGKSPKKSLEEIELEKVLALSEAEAKVADMDDEARIKAAIEQSLIEEQSKEVKGEEVGGSSKRRLEDGLLVGPSSSPPKKVHRTEEPKDEEVGDPSLDDDSFDSRSERNIEKLNGSLDLLYCKGWIRSQERKRLRNWMLNELAWHRVTYIQPRSKQRIITPRFTATFGKDDTGSPDHLYKFPPKPFPPLLDRLRKILEEKTGARFNAIIINYYADGKDSISYHSDDEAFLGKSPTIASISLGASRDFYLRRKAPANQSVPDATSNEKMGTKGKGPAAQRPTEKMVLEDGDLLVMKGRTQADWEHSIPKRTSYVGGRINMTFRRVMNVSGTNNFIRYNRMGDGDSPQFRWSEKTRQMVPGSGGI
ncbi:uncharacterized protein FA14DRAFT_172920 [Meira miltonrushii]|uniref:Fe2OG dioxygenase domain-containing protein n=1 Tax=Meira miltonrushii TaxID=1280837 RepID=A0A316VGC6_9BASI|nr:uncharacterized protein FA14DRAFT_172920 [Meira miltonrushii]PWN36374.1 hypothetical protein FA14DRAFT_172920 [Meira miltonrushii]